MAKRRIQPTKNMLAVAGAEEVLKNISDTLNRISGEAFKDMCAWAGAPIADQARANVQSMPVSEKIKTALGACIVVNKGTATKANAIVRVTQPAGVAILGSTAFVPNPYWWEYGTAPRYTSTGHFTGKITGTPYFRPAVVTSRPIVRQRLIDGMKKLTGAS